MKNKLINLFSELKGFKFVATLVSEYKRQKVMIKQNMIPFIQTQAEAVINKSDIDDVFESIYSTIKSNIQISLGNDSG